MHQTDFLWGVGNTRFFLALVFFAGLSTGAGAATFTSWSTFGALGCQDAVQNSSAVTSYCGAATIGSLTAETYGAAGNGTVSAYASAWSNRDSTGFGTFYNSSRTFAILTDSITATWRGTGAQFTGTAAFGLDLLGSFEADSASSARATGNFVVDGSVLYAFDSAADVADYVNRATFDFSGTSSIRAFVDAQARSCAILDPGTTCYSVADLGASLRLTGLSFFDASGTDVTSQLVVTSGSGFDYVTGADPHQRGPSLVPLPASSLLLVAGLGALVGLRRRSKA